MAIPEPKIIKLNAIANNEVMRPTSLDYRSARVDEYFRSMELSVNSIRAYKRSLTIGHKLSLKSICQLVLRIRKEEIGRVFLSCRKRSNN